MELSKFELFPIVIRAIHLEDETDAICSMHEGDEKCIQGFSPETSTGETTWETQVDERIALKYILGVQDMRVWTGVS
jgi:hypothetical protein